MGDIYFSIEASTQLAYYLTTLGSRGVDVTSNSYGYSDQDNDGFDAASQEAAITHTYIGTRTLGISSTGNGAPGFGTTTPPSPPQWLSVGASAPVRRHRVGTRSRARPRSSTTTSSRGPAAGLARRGRAGVDVVADGAYSTGDATLQLRSRRDAWRGRRGAARSRSTPVAAGAAALVYDGSTAKSHPGALPANFQVLAKSILEVVRAGSAGTTRSRAGRRLPVDAGRAVDLGLVGQGPSCPTSGGWATTAARNTTSSPTWSPRADPNTPGLPGERLPARSRSADRQLVEVATETIDWTSKNVSRESTYNFNAPDYLIDISNMIKQHPGADLMVVRANYPYAKFDGNGDYTADQAWRLLTYSWTDVNKNRRLWRDGDFRTGSCSTRTRRSRARHRRRPRLHVERAGPGGREYAPLSGKPPVPGIERTAVIGCATRSSG